MRRLFLLLVALGPLSTFACSGRISDRPDAAQDASIRGDTSATDTPLPDASVDVPSTVDAAMDGSAPDAPVADAPADASSDAPPATLTAISFDVIPTSDPDFVAPARGANTFYTYNQAVQIPVAGTDTWSLDNDIRLYWREFETGRDTYDWSTFDSNIHYSIDHHQRFAFRVMVVCDDCSATVSGARIGYPTYLHDAMQTESVHDWSYSGYWIPNWNSPTFLSRFEALLNAIANHIATTSYHGVSYRDVIYRIDIGGYGHWGEWHTYPWDNCGCIPSGANATDATLERMIDAHSTAFPNYPLILLVGTFAADVSPAVSYYALMASNAWGPFGWRSDHIGSVRNWYDGYTFANTRVVSGTMLQPLIMNRWQTSPIVGEPMTDLGEVSNDGASCAFYDMPRQITFFHHSQFSNAMAVARGVSCAEDNYRAASKASGYRIVLESGAMTADVTDHALSVDLGWHNVGIAPPYERWNVTFELRNSSGAAVWTGTSRHALFRFLPQMSSTDVRDDFTLPASVAAGSYSLVLVIRDPTGYRDPFPLAIRGRASDGSYPLGTVTVH